MEAFNREALKLAIEGSVVRLYQAQTQTVDPFRNTLDCFSASIDALTQNITMDDWFKQELERQKQKTKQNAIGTLHEEILGSIGGVENLPVGNLIDIKCDQKQIIAEVKNKHNTTKGNHKVQIYRDLANKLEELPGYIGYYVEILPKSQSRYDKPFTPSDNQTHAQLEARDDIRVIDGRSFYALLTGFDNALDELYEELPSIISEIISEQFGVTLEPHKVTGSGLFS
jgi:hypothetical protein